MIEKARHVSSNIAKIKGTTYRYFHKDTTTSKIRATSQYAQSIKRNILRMSVKINALFKKILGSVFARII